MFDRMIHTLSTFRPRGAAQRDHALKDHVMNDDIQPSAEPIAASWP
jgi:hypothetical protein